jgi:hypothetical protein
MAAFAVGIYVGFMVGGPGEDSDSFKKAQLGRGTGAVAESLSIDLPDFADERGFSAHAVCALKILTLF